MWWRWHLTVSWRTLAILLGFILLFLRLGNRFVCLIIHVDGLELKVFLLDEAHIVGDFLVLEIHLLHLLKLLLHLFQLRVADNDTGSSGLIQFLCTVAA